MDHLYLKPCDGMTIPHPDTTGPIGKDGAWVPNTKFYRGFLSRKEAVTSKPPKKTDKPAAQVKET